MIGPVEIDRRLGFHPATTHTGPRFDKNRRDAITLASVWDLELPDSREKSLAFTALQEALMWANASIACQ